MNEEHHPDVMLDIVDRAEYNGATSLRSDEWLDDRFKHNLSSHPWIKHEKRRLRFCSGPQYTWVARDRL